MSPILELSPKVDQSLSTFGDNFICFYKDFKLYSLLSFIYLKHVYHVTKPFQARRCAGSTKMGISGMLIALYGTDCTVA
jgi:hypothetical protein